MDELVKEIAAVPNMRRSAVENFLKRHPDGRLAMVAPKVKAVNEAKREILHVISTSSVDRAGDIVVPGGGRFDSYLRNPVVLQDHDYSVQKIIGSAERIETESDTIWARTKFLDTPRGLESFKLSRAGLGGWSIGFKPEQYDSIEDDKGRRKGFRFKVWELLEYSHVAIPMNQDAVNTLIERGIASESFVSEFFEIVEEKAEPAPVEPAAAPGPNVACPVDPHPALAPAMRRMRRTLQLGAVDRAVREALKEMDP